MKTEEIRIAGKPVKLGYCYATEIAYKDYTDEEIHVFLSEAFVSITAEQPRMPDIKKTIFLILSAVMACYAALGEEAPVKDVDLMNDTTPEELGKALGAVIRLYNEFYRVAEPTPEPKKKGKGGAKN